MCDTAPPGFNFSITFALEVFEMFILDTIIKGMRPKPDAVVAKIIFGTGVGMAMGLLVGLLLAPRSGAETREMVAENAKDAADVIGKAINTTASSIKKALNKNDPITKETDHPEDK
jgi:hypothetical protein